MEALFTNEEKGKKNLLIIIEAATIFMDTMIFKWRDELIQVNPDDIVYFQADGNYSVMILASLKEQLLSMNLSKVQLILDEQLGGLSSLFERVGRDLIIRKAYLFSIQTLRKKLILAVPNSDKFFELQVSKDSLKKLKENQEVKPTAISSQAQLRDLQTRKIYPLNRGQNRFGRKSNSTECEYPIDNGDNQISRLHFTVEVQWNNETNIQEYYLIDSQSANGTYLDDILLTKGISTFLNFGSKIKVGKTEFIFENTDIDRTEIV
jgi:hypothetical protein